eukprot:TRINITY_DN15047_c0_g2_i2.p1 TRINITY_DN15047_c0_g2~~TRINITY_DN15047_c0_g2_i2.p1  ORF type:complete len:689 (-),score=87.68 TRINITY_DN15047_c0_g2_i2:157-2223(-)
MYGDPDLVNLDDILVFLRLLSLYVSGLMVLFILCYYAADVFSTRNCCATLFESAASVPTTASSYARRLVARLLDLEDDAVNPRVHEIVRKRRLRHGKLACKICMNFSGIVVAFLLYNVTMSLRGNVDDSPFWQDWLYLGKATQAEFDCIICAFLFSAVHWLRPDWLTLRGLHALHLMCIVRMSFDKTEYCSTIKQNYSVQFAADFACTRFLLAVLVENFAVTAVLNVFFSLNRVWTFLPENVCRTSMPSFYDKWAGEDAITAAAGVEVYVLITVLTLAYLLESQTFVEAQSTYDAKVACRMEASVKSLLTVLCDAVIVLDADFRFRAHSPQLSALLLHSGGRSLEGSAFTDLMYGQEDRQRFLSTAQESSALVMSLEEENNDAEVWRHSPSLHLTLMDGNQTRMASQLFFTSTLDLDDQRLHIIGIRECEGLNAASNDIDPESHDHFALGASALARYHTGGAGAAAAEVSSCSHSVAAFEAADASESDELAVVWIDTTTPQLTMHKWSPQFASLAGTISTGTGLVSWFEEGTELQSRILHHVEEAKYLGELYTEEGPEPIGLGMLAFKPPSKSLAFHARLRLDIEPQPDSASSCASSAAPSRSIYSSQPRDSEAQSGAKPILARLIFYNVRPARRPRTASGGSRSSLGAGVIGESASWLEAIPSIPSAAASLQTEIELTPAASYGEAV